MAAFAPRVASACPRSAVARCCRPLGLPDRSVGACFVPPQGWFGTVTIPAILRFRKTAMGTATFSEFEAQARAQGFDEVLERDWTPATVLDTHTHPFSVQAIVVRGEMWLTAGGNTQHLRKGDTFSLGRDIAHSERYGDAGALLWVARRKGVSNDGR